MPKLKSAIIISLILSLLSLSFAGFGELLAVKAQQKLGQRSEFKGTILSDSTGKSLAQIKENSLKLGNLPNIAKRAPLKVSKKDLEHVKNGDIDARILRTAIYLVTPRWGSVAPGAGYEHLKIKLMKGYDSPLPRRDMSREYPDGTDPNRSVHASGQGMDIYEIDNILTTLTEYKVGGDKHRPQPPVPIKVAWQSEEGYRATGGFSYSLTTLGLFNQFGLAKLNDTLLYEISDLFGIETDLKGLSLDNLDDVAKLLAIEWILATADLPDDLDLSTLDLDNLSWEGVFTEISSSYLANLLNLDSEGLAGNSFTDIKENLGRAEVENRFDVPAGSMDTDSGKSRDIVKQMLTRRLEHDLLLPRNSLSDIATNKDTQKKFATAIKDISNHTDQALDMPGGGHNGISYTNILSGKAADTDTKIEPVLFFLGCDYIGKLLDNHKKGQIDAREWILNKGSGSKIDETRLAGNVGLKSGDVENIFIKDGAYAVFNRIGETLLLQGLGHAALTHYDPLTQLANEVEFYLDTAKNLKGELENIKDDPDLGTIAKDTLKIVNKLNILEDNNLAGLEGDIKELNKASDKVNDFQKAKTELSDSDLNSLLSIENLLNSFVEGIKIPFLPDLKLDNLDIPEIKIYDKKVSASDLISAILSKDPKKNLSKIGEEILKSQWEFAWALPSGTLEKILKGESISENAEEALAEIASSYINHEFDLGADFSGKDLIDIFSGDFSKLIELGGAMADEALNLADGSIAKIIEEDGNAVDILQKTGSLLIGQMLGFDFPIALEGNFGANVGYGIIENRLGLSQNSLKNYPYFKDLVADLGVEKAALTFHLDLEGQSQITDKTISNSSSGIAYVAKILSVDESIVTNYLNPSDPTSTEAFVKNVGERAAFQITTDKIAAALGFDIQNNQALAETLELLVYGILKKDWDKGETDNGHGLRQGLNGSWNLTIGRIALQLADLSGINLEKTIGFTTEEIKTIFDDSDSFEDVLTKAGIRLFENYITNFASGRSSSGGCFSKYYTGKGGCVWKEGIHKVMEKIDKWATGPIGEYSGITTGELKDFLITLSSAQLANMYRSEFGETSITFEEIKNAFTGDPAVVTSWYAENDIDPAEATEDEKKMAEREGRKSAVKDMQYKIMDARLHKFDKNIKAGFAKEMFEGTAGDRRDMLTDFVIDKYAGEVVAYIEAETGLDLDITTEGLKDAIHNNELDTYLEKAGRNALTGFFENKLRELTGVDFASGTIEKLLDGDFSGALNANKTIISRFIDEWLGLPSGTTHVIWSAYDTCKEAWETYKAARVAIKAGDVEALKGFDNPEAALKAAKADLMATIGATVAVIVTYVFAKQFAKIDQKFGLPAGTTSAIVSMAIQMIFGASIPFLGWAMLVFTILTGTYKMRLTSTPCNYYPKKVGDWRDIPSWMKIKGTEAHEDQLGVLPPEAPYCPGEWQYKPKFANDVYKDIAIQSAQYKVAMIIGDLLYMGKNLKKHGEKIAQDGNMYPVQILTLRGVDRARYLNLITSHYGTLAAERGWTGVIVSEKVWDHVHVGY